MSWASRLGESSNVEIGILLLQNAVHGFAAAIGRLITEGPSRCITISTALVKSAIAYPFTTIKKARLQGPLNRRSTLSETVL
jgi:hypothetical protein